MSRSILAFAAAALFAAAPAFCADHASAAESSGAAGPGSATPSRSAQSGATSDQQKAPPGFVLLEEDVVYMTAEQPQQHLLRAHEQMAANNPKAAAAELRMAANYIKMQEARPGEIGKQLLSPWRQNLEKLASQVSKGDVKAQDLTKDAADTSYALAKYFSERAVDELKNKHEVTAGYDLSAAAGNFEQALAWSQQKPQDKQVQAIAESRSASDQLITAANLAADQSAGQSGEASPASSKQPAAGTSGQAHPSSQANTQNASKAADDLLKSIDSLSSKFSPSPAQQRENTGDHAGHASAGQSGSSRSSQGGASK